MLAHFNFPGICSSGTEFKKIKWQPMASDLVTLALIPQTSFYHTAELKEITEF